MALIIALMERIKGQERIETNMMDMFLIRILMNIILGDK
jgi:hypothetical protein